MRTLRRLAYVLLALIIISWIIAWFVGRYVFFREVEPRLNALNAAGYTYEAEGHGLGGFPFSYSLNPKGGKISEGPDVQSLWDLSDATRINISLPGTAWGLITNQQVGARIHLDGSHRLPNAIDMDLASGWVLPKISQVRLQNGAPAWVFDGLDFEFRDTSLVRNGIHLGTVRRISLAMNPLNDRRGYSYRFVVQDLELPEDTFNQVPNTIDRFVLEGKIRPQISSELVLLASELEQEQDPIGALTLFAESVGQILTSEPGLYLEEGTFIWGDAQFDLTFDAPLNIHISAANATLDLEGTIAGTHAETLLQNLIREPSARQSGLAVPAALLMATASSYGLDLENGTPANFSGTLFQIDLSGLNHLPDGLILNGRSIAGF